MGKLYQGQFPALISALVLQDVTFGGNWVQDTQDLYVLFLTTTCESVYDKTKILIKKISHDLTSSLVPSNLLTHI